MTPDDPRIDMYASPYVDGRSASVVQIESNKLLPVLVVLCVLVGMSFMTAFWAVDEARKAEREARILKVNVDGYEKALALHGIDPHGHLPGEPK